MGSTLPPIIACLLLTVAGTGIAAAQSDDHTGTHSGSADSVVGPDGATASREDSRPSLDAVRLTGEIRIDGRIDESGWAAAEVASGFTQQRPNPGVAATQRTEARVLYDEEAIYVAMRMYDETPERIAAQLARRDASGIYSDWAQVLVDSYGDNRTAYRFGLNPEGVQKDVHHYDDTSEDLSWDAVWEGAATVDSAGWAAEFRIPLSQLRFDTGTDRWGINFLRENARLNERSFWAEIPPDAGGFVSRFGELAEVGSLEAPGQLEVEPYSVARLTRAPGEDDDPFFSSNDFFGSAGADLKYGLTSNLTLTGTVNPDFGQVEADPSVVNLSAFETRFSEKRPFFLEGSDIFGVQLTPGFNDQQLFYSRRIGRSPQGGLPGEARYGDASRATTILGAAKVSGKSSGWSFGFLDALTGRETARFVNGDGLRDETTVEPLTNYGMARMIRDFREGQSAVGLSFTATNRDIDDERLDFLHTSAYTGGVDARHRFWGGDYEATTKIMASHVRGDPDALTRTQLSPTRYFQRPDATHVSLDPSRETLSGGYADLEVRKIGGGHWSYGFTGHAVTPGFEVNDLGFQRDADRLMGATFVGYRQFRPGDVLRSWNVNSSAYSGWTFGGEHIAAGNNLNGFMQFLNYWSVFGGLSRNWETLSTTALRGGPAIVDPGSTFFHLGLFTDDRRQVSAGLNLNGRFEDETDGRSLSFSPRIEFRPSGRMDFSLRPSYSVNRDAWQYVREAEVDGEPLYLFGRLDQRTASVTLRLDYTFTPDLSLQLYAQPFISGGDYSGFMEVANPRAVAFEDRFRTYEDEELTYDADERLYAVDPDADGSVDHTFADPDFNFRQLRSNVVLRWEYRPGSTLFLVWNQGRTDRGPTGVFAPGRDFEDLLRTEGTNTFLVKMNYWLDL